MHDLNRQWFGLCEKFYTLFFRDPSWVIEFGSYNINGTIRDHFQCTNYIGLDWRPGPCVDLISLAHKAPFPNDSVDTIASASMLEHDPHWSESLTRMTSILKPSGAMFLSWGAAFNPQHCLPEAPDGAFHSLRAGLVLAKLKDLGMYVHDFRYECNIVDSFKKPSPKAHQCGEVCLIAFKDPTLGVGEQFIDNLLPEDSE